MRMSKNISSRNHSSKTNRAGNIESSQIMTEPSRGQLWIDLQLLNHLSKHLTDRLRSTVFTPGNLNQVKKIFSSWQSFISSKKKCYEPYLHGIAAPNSSWGLTELIAAVCMKGHVLHEAHENSSERNNRLDKFTKWIALVDLKTSHEGYSITEAIVILELVCSGHCESIPLLEREGLTESLKIRLFPRRFKLCEEGCATCAEFRQAEYIHRSIDSILEEFPTSSVELESLQISSVSHSGEVIRIALRENPFLYCLIKSLLVLRREIITSSPFVKACELQRLKSTLRSFQEELVSFYLSHARGQIAPGRDQAVCVEKRGLDIQSKI